VAEIACIAVSDPFVMSAWEKEKGATGKVLMLCGPDASFTRSLGLSLDLSGFGLGERSQRYSMIVPDGVVATTINAEKSIFHHEASAASSLLASAAE
jgi:glutaredoxin/glutathione-dependent peroxiredoxin